MARIALGITLALLLVACFLGFQTRTKIQGLNDNISRLTTDLNNTKQELAKTQAELASTKDALAKTQADLKTTQDDLAKTKSDLDTANKQIDDDKTAIAGKDSKIADLQGQIDKLKTPTGTQITPEQVAKMQSDLKDRDNQIAELKVNLDTLNNKVKDLQSHSDDLQKEIDRYKSGFMKNGLEGEVLAVNQGWGFVVLSIGDRQGIAPNGELILQRNGNQIGKVRVTSVEPSTSVADIIPGSLARGVRVQPGDRVIFQGK